MFDMKDLTKWALIGGAVFLAYDYFTKDTDTAAEPAAEPAGNGQQPTGNTQQPAAQPPIQQPSAQQPPVQQPVAQIVPADSVLKRAAANAHWAPEAGQFGLNWHQWNWYRSQYNSNLPVYAPEDVGADHTSLITATQYHAMLAAKGLSGLGYLGGLGNTFRWRN